jgi:hypothetical protein
LVKPGVVAIDGTWLAGNKSRSSNRDLGKIAREILAEAKATDEAEDELYGDARGDGLPEQLRTRKGRREFFRQTRERLAAKDAEVPAAEPQVSELTEGAERIVARGQGRQGWTREARRRVEQARCSEPDPIPRERTERPVTRGGAAGGRPRRGPGRERRI